MLQCVFSVMRLVVTSWMNKSVEHAVCEGAKNAKVWVSAASVKMAF